MLRIVMKGELKGKQRFIRVLVAALVVLGFVTVIPPYLAEAGFSSDFGDFLIRLEDVKANATLEPTGCLVDKDKIQLRFDLYLEPDAPGYNIHYVYVVDETSPEYLGGYPGGVDEFGRPISRIDYELWRDGLPHIWQNNPFLCVFANVDLGATDGEIRQLEQDILRQAYDVWEDETSNRGVDKALQFILPSPTLEEPSPVKLMELESRLADIKSKTADFKYDPRLILSMPFGSSVAFANPGPIDVGPGATDRATDLGGLGYTVFDHANPANGTGLITQFEIWLTDSGTGVKVGVIYGSDPNYTTRDYASVGDVVGGSKQTFSPLSIDVVAGDLAACYTGVGGDIERDNTGGSDSGWLPGDQFPSGSQAWDSPQAGDAVSVYATGSTVVLPTVTSQVATNVEDTTATGNGNITNTGGENCTIRGIVWDLASHGDPGNVAPGASGYANDIHSHGSYGVGAFTESLTGLPTGDTIYYRAYAYNAAGYDYSNTERSFLTKPAAPTNVAATDGVHTDKVVITWNKSTGATNYRVYEGINDISGLLGDVATYDDTTAAAGTISNAGTVTASDGTETAHTALSLAGEATTNGATRTYKVVASNATGNSDDSGTNTGYRGVGAITYQWQRSAGDADGGYGNIGGATTDPYNDTNAPAGTISNAGAVTASDGTFVAHVALSLAGEATTDGAGRYYQCILSATGASNSPATSNNNRGYRGVGAITYQWQRSAADSPAGFGNIGGGTTDPYNDTGAPANGDGRYFQCVLTSTDASNSPATSDNDRGFRIGIPEVTTQAATNITDTTATGNGTIVDVNGENATERGFDWDIDSGAPYANEATDVGSFGTGAYTKALTGLPPSDTIYYRAKAQNSAGWGYGGELTFDTHGPPDVTTTAATNIEEITATIGGNITDVNGANAGTRGVEWDTDSGAPYANDWNEIGNFSTGAYTRGLTTLTQGELYYYRAYAINTYGTGTGAEDTFLTKPIEPNTLDATAGIGQVDLTWVKGTGAQKTYIRGKDGSYPANRADGYLVYNDTGAAHTDAGLVGGHTYYYRAWSYATEGGKEQYSDNYDFTFETPSMGLNLWFQPVTVISGTTMPDRSPEGNTGTITWGANPSGVAVAMGSLLPEGAAIVAGEGITPEVGGELNPPAGWLNPGDAAMGQGTIFKPLAVMIADLSHTPEWMVWWFFYGLLSIVALAVTFKYLKHLWMAGIAAVVVAGLFYQMGIVPYWFIIINVVVVISTAVMERTPAL